jgi:hypothetical protein
MSYLYCSYSREYPGIVKITSTNDIVSDLKNVNLYYSNETHIYLFAIYVENIEHAKSIIFNNLNLRKVKNVHGLYYGGIYEYVHLFYNYIKINGGILFDDKKQIARVFDIDGDVIMV